MHVRFRLLTFWYSSYFDDDDDDDDDDDGDNDVPATGGSNWLILIFKPKLKYFGFDFHIMERLS